MQASPSSNDLFSACYVLLRGSTDMTPSPPPPVLTTWLPFNVRIRQATSWHVKAAGCPVLCEPRGARDEEMKESERIRPACSWTGGGQVTRIQLCAILEALFSRETHQGAWNLTKALLPELRTSVSKLDLVRETLPASTLYAPRAMSPPRAAIAAALAIAIALDGKKKLRPSGQKSGFENLVTPPPAPHSTRSAQATRRRWGRAEVGHAKPTVGQYLSAPACSTAGMEDIRRFEWLRGRHRRCFACARDPSRLLFPRLRRCMVRSAAHSCETPPPDQRCEPCQ